MGGYLFNPRWEERHTLASGLSSEQAEARIASSPALWVPQPVVRPRPRLTVFGHGGRTLAELSFERLGSGCRIEIWLRLPYPVAAQVAMVWLASLITVGAFVFGVVSGSVDSPLSALPVAVVLVIATLLVLNRLRNLHQVGELLGEIQRATAGLVVE